MKKFLIPFILCLVILLAVLTGYGVKRYQEYKKYEPLRYDMEHLVTDDYTAAFFATYPIDRFKEEDFSHYREIYPIKSTYCIPDLETLNSYMARMSESLNDVELVYLGIRPDIVTADQLMTLFDTWSDKHYEVIIAYPSLAYWKGLSEEEFTEKLAAYRTFINDLIPLYDENEWMQDYLSVYFYGSTEWLVGNPNNYESDFGVNEGISHSLSMYTDGDHGFRLTVENFTEELEAFEELVADCRKDTTLTTPQYPDLSDWDVVFFGDSVIGSFSETSSIPGAFGGLTGAHYYNCGKGGSNATMIKENSLGIPAVVDLFLAKDVSHFEENTQIYQGMTDYFEHAKKKRNKCFVLNFGLNDYYSGLPVRNEEDPYDIYTYAGAMRTAINKLSEAYPDAVIVLMTPNFTNYFGCGLEPQSDVGGLLPDYVGAVVSIAEANDYLLLDNYTTLGIDIDNHTEYLLDGTHPNESTRYTIAQNLARLMLPYGKEPK
ncbi:MAG: SGNH/GDSL hydrolase family protein [Lachnospiraceae bacterium]|nr:SGNH/GDSL hydrolase family protein [Lachnospiraceae bacterium]